MSASQDAQRAQRRSALAAGTVAATDAAVARWSARIAEGMTVEQALRSAYLDGCSYGLDLVNELRPVQS
jgi:hypothetical protein